MQPTSVALIAVALSVAVSLLSLACTDSSALGCLGRRAGARAVADLLRDAKLRLEASESDSMLYTALVAASDAAALASAAHALATRLGLPEASARSALDVAASAREAQDNLLAQLPN